MVNNSININKSTSYLKITDYNKDHDTALEIQILSRDGQARSFVDKWNGWPSLFALSSHNTCIYNFCYLRNNWYKASECQHEIEEHCLILTYYS